MTVEEIQELAVLSRIALTDEEARSMAGEFDEILGYVAQVEAAAKETGEGVHAREVGPHANVLRADEAPHEPDSYTEALLAAVPEREGRYVRVKKVL